MPTSELPELPVGHYRLTFAGRPRRWPEFAGSAWRGVLGRELRRALCVTGLPVCSSCALYRSCGYTYIFETPPPPEAGKLRRATAAPHPYVLRPRPWRPGSGALELELVLLGRGNVFLPQLIGALGAGASHGIGPDRERLELVRVEQRAEPGGEIWAEIHRQGEPLRALPARVPATPAAPAGVRVRLRTPLRATRNEARVTVASFRFAAFFMTLLRRISLLTYFHAERALEADFAVLAAAAEALPLAAARLGWQDWVRQSSRQNRRVPMGGLTGEFELRGPALAAFWPFLWLGQWTHAGKGACMGLGEYTLAACAAAAAAPGPGANRPAAAPEPSGWRAEAEA